MVFIYNTLFVAILSLLFKFSDKRIKKNVFLIICFLQMFFIQGLRDITVGTDTSLYVNTYLNFKESSYYTYQFTHFEKGFQLIYEIMRSLNIDGQMFLIIISFIIAFGFGWFIKTNSVNVYLSTFIFSCLFFPNSFNIMRQYLAMAISINSYQLIKENKNIRAAIIILFSSAIHVISILFFIPFILKLIKHNKIMNEIIILISVLFFLFGNYIVEWIAPLVGKSFYLSGYEVTRFFRMTSFLTLSSAVLIWYFMRNCRNIYKADLKLLLNISLINVCFGILYLKYEFFSRIIELFNLYVMISFPLGLKYSKINYRGLYYFVVYLVFFLLMLNSVYNSGSGVENYKLFF